MLQELQTQSHEGRMGVRYPDTGRDRKGEGETQEQRAGETGGWGRESKRVPRALGKGAGSKGDLQRKRH